MELVHVVVDRELVVVVVAVKEIILLQAVEGSVLSSRGFPSLNGLTVTNLKSIHSPAVSCNEK